MPSSVTDSSANVGQILRNAVARWPDRTAAIDVGRAGDAARELTFAELEARARSVAAWLAQHGMGRGQSVALIGENSAELVSAWFGIVYAGCAVVPIPVLSAPPELRFRVEHAGCGAVLFDARRAELVTEALASVSPEPARLDLATITAARDASTAAEPATTAPGDDAMILYTSGTMGTPKGAVISHAALGLHTAALAQHALRLAEHDRVLGVLPLTHSYGCRMVMLASFFAGARCVLVPRFDAPRTLGLMHEHAITWVPAVPTMLAAWAAEPPGPVLPALRWCLSAGAPLPDEIALRAERRLGVEVRQGYGMTEATFCTINAPPDARVLGSVGKPVAGVELRVVDAAGHELAAGTSGEVVVRGQNLMSRYLHDAEATAAARADGFFHSGDVGRVDAEGRLFIVDRIKDLIIRGGFNVYPSEVEAALAAHPDVRDVAVVGRPDAYYGEEVVAVVVPRDGASLEAAALVEWARPRIGATKLPREVAFVTALPLGPSGKVQKRELREALLSGRITSTRVEPPLTAPR
ncbi:MAG: class I adenylate-forming enzyme family protein [Polyangiales bacterium]